MAQSVFSKTMTVEQFKRSIGTNGLQVKGSVTPGKSGFMTDDAGNVVGAISSKITSKADIVRPVIGIGDDGRAVLFNAGEGSAAILATL